MRAHVTLQLLRANRHRFSRAVVHSFDGTAEELAAVLELNDVWVGVNGCSLKTEENVAVAASIPIDRLVIETDAPWCGVRPTHAASKHVVTVFKDKKPKKYEQGLQVKGRNEPCNIRSASCALRVPVLQALSTNGSIVSCGQASR